MEQAMLKQTGEAQPQPMDVQETVCINEYVILFQLKIGLSL